MRIISGPEPLTPQQLGAKLWNAEYKGKTIGQWASQAWLGSDTEGDSERESELEELGLLALPDPAHLYFLHMHKLIGAFPEFKPYTGTLLSWHGVLQPGIPLPKTPGSRSRLPYGPKPLTHNQLGAKLWDSEYKGKTIGQWALEAWRDSPEALPTSVLAELGFSVRHAPQYLCLSEPLELTRWIQRCLPCLPMLLTWEGVEAGGIPRFKESNLPATAPTKAPKARKAAEPKPARQRDGQRETATVIQFPGRR